MSEDDLELDAEDMDEEMIDAMREAPPDYLYSACTRVPRVGSQRAISAAAVHRRCSAALEG